MEGDTIDGSEIPNNHPGFGFFTNEHMKLAVSN